MKFMLDTNICIELIRKKSDKVLKAISRRKPEDIVLSSITLSELEYGVNKSSDPIRNRIALTVFLSSFVVLSFNSYAAVQYGIIKSDLEKKGQRIGNMDMLIAAHALSLNVTLVTNNTDEFKRVNTLKIEDWL